MTILTTLAVSATIVVLGFGVATIFQERGYRFDLRRRRSVPPVGADRRENDARGVIEPATAPRRA
jgi:hypothetical protein